VDIENVPSSLEIEVDILVQFRRFCAHPPSVTQTRRAKSVFAIVNDRELRFSITLVALRPLGARAPSLPANRLRRPRFARKRKGAVLASSVVRSTTFAKRFGGGSNAQRSRGTGGPHQAG
jgi:hypothetical protein